MLVRWQLSEEDEISNQVTASAVRTSLRPSATISTTTLSPSSAAAGGAASVVEIRYGSDKCPSPAFFVPENRNYKKIASMNVKHGEYPK